MAKEQPLLSLVICTRNRPELLSLCLEGIAAMEGSLEVIVVDSASTLPIEPLVKNFADKIPSLRYCREDRSGLSLARNRGIAEATSDLVAFLDDDSVPDSKWARRIAAPFSDSEVVCVGGACLPNFELPPPRWLSARLLQFAGITNFGSYPKSIHSRADYPFGGNVCYRKQALVLTGGFSPALGRTAGSSLLSGEETPVIETLLASGKKVFLEPGAVMHHLVAAERCQSAYYWRRLWWQGVSRSRAGWRWKLAAKLAAAVPIRLCLYLLTRDRVYLYRLAESAGYWKSILTSRKSPQQSGG